MKPKIAGKIAISALAFVGAACAPRATGAAKSDAVLLRFRPEPGQSYRTVSEMDESSSQTIRGRELHTDRVVTLVTRYDIDPPPDVPWTVAPYALLVGRTYTVAIAADGTRTFEGADSLMNELVSRVNAPPGVSPARFRAMVKAQLGEGFFTNVMRQFSSMLPEKPVSVGESWTRSVNLGGMVSIHETATLTLRERRNGVAIIDMRSETSGDGIHARTALRASTHMKSTGTGSMEIDEATGRTFRSTFETESSMIMVLERSPAGRQEIPITTHIVFTTRSAGAD